MSRSDLAHFLRSRRERIVPDDVDPGPGPRRRTPGMRREEVARSAHISTEYYTRLEQARAPRPSREVLAGLARALRLSDAENDHLHNLAGSPTIPPSPSREVRQSILDLIDRLPTAAAIVTSATFEVIAWNHMAAALLEDFSALAPHDRNLLRRAFIGPHPQGRRLYGVPDSDAFAHSAVHRLRATAGRYPENRDVGVLVSELLSQSAEFAELWESHDVCSQPSRCTTFSHPSIGSITVSCDVLDIADRDQQVIIYTAAPGSASEEALRALADAGSAQSETIG